MHRILQIIITIQKKGYDDDDNGEKIISNLSK